MFCLVPNIKMYKKPNLLLQHQNNHLSFTVFHILYCFLCESIELHKSISEDVFRSIKAKLIIIIMKY